MVTSIKKLIHALKISPADATQLFQLIETEVMSLHDGNIARFKIRPGEFEQWQKMQN